MTSGIIEISSFLLVWFGLVLVSYRCSTCMYSVEETAIYTQG